MNAVRVLGVGRSGNDAPASSKSLNELIFAATRAALDDAGVSLDDVDSVVLAAHDVDDGRGITSMTAAGAAGALMKDEVRLAEDGLFGLALASARLLSGAYDMSLVVSWGKASETDVDAVSRLAFEPFFDRPIAQNDTIALALQAMRFRAMSSAPDIDETARRLVAARLAAAPFDHRSARQAGDDSGVSAQDPAFADDADGACAVVLGGARANESLDPDGLWLLGSGWCSASYHLGTGDMTRAGTVASAAERAFARSGVEDASAFDVVELDSPSAYHEMLALEALGLAGSSEGPALVRSLLDGDRARPLMGVNGGAYGWKPLAASGLARFIDVVQTMRGRQVSLGLAHGTSGNAWQSHCFAVVGRDQHAHGGR